MLPPDDPPLSSRSFEFPFRDLIAARKDRLGLHYVPPRTLRIAITIVFLENAIDHKGGISARRADEKFLDLRDFFRRDRQHPVIIAKMKRHQLGKQLFCLRFQDFAAIRHYT